MKFKTLTGSEKRITKARKYLIDWDGKSLSKVQFKTKKFLEKFWLTHVVFEEVHGAQHTKYVPFFHGRRSNFVKQLSRDQQKIDFCELNSIILVEIFDGDKLTKKIFENCGVYL